MNKEKTNIMEQEEVLICECCNYIIDDDDYTECDGRIICSDCLEEHTTICDCCGSRIWREDAYSDENTTVCTDCYEEHYTRCSCCDSLLYEDEAYYSNGDAYCRDCYEEEREALLELLEYGANILEAGELVPMNNPPTARVEALRNMKHPDLEMAEDWLYEMSETLQKACRLVRL